MSFFTSRQHPDLHPSHAKLSGEILEPVGLKLIGFWWGLLPSLGYRASPGIPPGEGFVWFVKNLHELTQIHLLSLLQGTWKSPANPPLLPLRLSCPEENLWQFNLSKLIHCKNRTLRKWSQLVKEEVVILPLLPFTTYLGQHFNSPVKLQESLIPIFWSFWKEKMKVLVMQRMGHSCECAVSPLPGFADIELTHPSLWNQ